MILEELSKLNLQNKDWVIVGGESGNKSSPLNHEQYKKSRKNSPLKPFIYKASSNVPTGDL